MVHKIPNIELLLSGYDIYFGNPSTTFGQIDPGFRYPIFKEVYKGSTTPDSLFDIPEGLSFGFSNNTCQIDFESKIIQGPMSYYEALTNKVSGINNSAFM